MHFAYKVLFLRYRCAWSARELVWLNGECCSKATQEAEVNAKGKRCDIVINWSLNADRWTERWEAYNTADCSFIIWHLGLQTFPNWYRRLTVTRSYHAFQLKGLQAEMKTDKDTISCIQMIMWYFINPHRENLFLSATLHREARGQAQLQQPTAGATGDLVSCSRTHQQGGGLSCFRSPCLPVFPCCWPVSPWRWRRPPVKHRF